jgi:hypothetical protein
MNMKTLDYFPNPADWILLPPGNRAIYRKPANEFPSDARLATVDELFLANQGYEFPWGSSPNPDLDKVSKLWKQHRIGMGGLYFTDWFKTAMAVSVARQTFRRQCRQLCVTVSTSAAEIARKKNSRLTRVLR